MENTLRDEEINPTNDIESTKDIDDVIKYFYSEYLSQVEQGEIFLGNGEITRLRFNYRFDDYFIAKDKVLEYYQDYEKSNRLELIPTLIVKNKEKFDSILREYIEVAYNFYNIRKDNPTYLKKFLLGVAFADLSMEDYNSPELFFKRKIDFMRDHTLSDFAGLNYCNEPVDREIGISAILGGEIFGHEEVSNPENETPKEFRLSIYDNFNAKYSFPVIRFGISENTAYIYAIQGKKKPEAQNEFTKNIRRRLYQVNDGFDTKNDTFENYEEGNLSDITASFLVALAFFIGLLKKKGVNNIIVTPFTVGRWNNRSAFVAEISSMHDGDPRYILEQEGIYRDINEKLIRTFLRLCSQMKNIEVLSYPFELDGSMYIRNIGEVECENPLLKEIYEIGLKCEEGRTI